MICRRETEGDARYRVTFSPLWEPRPVARKVRAAHFAFITQAFADKLTGKKIGCFATMGGNARDPKALAWMAKTSAALTEKGRGNTLKATFLCRGRIDPVLFDMMTKMAGGLTPEREARRKESETHPDRMDCLNAVAAMAPLFN